MSFNPVRILQRRAAVTALVINLSALSITGALADRTVRLDPGAVIPVRLSDTISSNSSQKGDTFSGTVKTMDGENYGLPVGTRIDGVVTGVRPQRNNDPGIIEVAFQRVRMPDGESFPIEGSLIGLDNKSVDRRSDGRLIAKPSHQNDRLTYAGMGAGAGLIVGLITKRPLEDAVLGGLLGYGFSALQKGHSNARDVVLKPGTELGVRIDRRAMLTAYRDPQSSRLHRTAGTDDYRVAPDRQEYDGSARIDDGADPTDVGVLVDDRDVSFDSTARPIIGHNGIVLVPVIPVLRAARVPYTYDSRTQTLRATGTADPVRLAIGSSIAVVNGTHRVRLDAPAQRISGTMYAPMKFLQMATGYDVHYDAASRTVVMTSR